MSAIIPAILTDSTDEAAWQVSQLQGVSSWVQMDVMDGQFVPEKSIEISELLALSFDFSLELHLMVQYPKKVLDQTQDDRIKRIIFHASATLDHMDVISAIRSQEKQVGLAINPELPIKDIVSVLPHVDSVLLMGVHPGKQGQTFITSVLDKIEEIRQSTSDMIIGVDGGVKRENVREIFTKGADYVAVGSGIWDADNIQERIAEFETLTQSA